ncbi:MAG: hypothetical protein M3164_00265 [Actinomycetota bacterium]|nr:hypothetical protein [Actinomycetota bacterium]
MGRLGLAEIVFLVVVLGLPLVGILDASLIPASAFESAGRSKRFWILIQILLGYIGAVIYFAAIRADVRFFTVPPSADWEEDSAQGQEPGEPVAIAEREEPSEPVAIAEQEPGEFFTTEQERGPDDERGET